MPFKMKSFVFWSGVYNAGLALTLTFPLVYRWLGLNVPAPLWGLVDRGLFGLYRFGADSSNAGFSPSSVFRILGIAAALHRRVVAHSRRTFRGSGLDCRTLGSG